MSDRWQQARHEVRGSLSSVVSLVDGAADSMNRFSLLCVCVFFLGGEGMEREAQWEREGDEEKEEHWVFWELVSCCGVVGSEYPGPNDARLSLALVAFEHLLPVPSGPSSTALEIEAHPSRGNINLTRSIARSNERGSAAYRRIGDPLWAEKNKSKEKKPYGAFVS